MDWYIFLHSLFAVFTVYFISYSIQRIMLHWKDGREKVITSSGRLLVKIACTVTCSLLEFAHIIDYVPSKYSEANMISRTIFFSLNGFSWLISSFLVYFDYSRRLSSQWKGQRLFWVFGLIANTCLVIYNFSQHLYKFKGENLLKFDVIQVLSYTLSIIICCLLSFYSIFRPNDFVITSPELYKRLKKSTMLFEESGLETEDIVIKANIIGYKIKQVQSITLLLFNVNISVNGVLHSVSRSLADFEALDLGLREKFPKSQYPNLNFPEFQRELLRKEDPSTRAKLLNVYISALCCSDFMTSELLNFLQIEGNCRDLLIIRNSIGFEDKIALSEDPGRSESSIYHYYTPALNLPANDSGGSQNLQWVINVSIPTYRIEEDSSIDYFVRSEILLLKIEKIRPYKFKDFCEFHKTLKKIVNPGVVMNFPSRNYTKTLKTRDKEGIEQRKKQLECYISLLANDPAYISKEVLEFLGDSIELNEIYTLIPMFKYRIHEESEWEGEISDDSSHYILYTYVISKTRVEENFEVQWKIMKRFREFDALNKKLNQRHGSPLLKQFLIQTGKIGKDESILPLPILPNKRISPLSTLNEIIDRKKMLEGYLNELLANPAIICSYQFREFIEDKFF